MSYGSKAKTALDLKDLIKLILDQNLSRESAIALTYWYSNPDGDSLEVKLNFLKTYENQVKNASCSSEDLAEIYYELIRNNLGAARYILSKYSKETPARSKSFTPLTTTKPNPAGTNPNPSQNFQPPNSPQNKFKEDSRSNKISEHVSQNGKSKQLNYEENVKTHSIPQQSKPEVTQLQSPKNPSIISRNSIQNSDSKYPYLEQEERKVETAYRYLSQDRPSTNGRSAPYNVAKPEEVKKPQLDLKIPDYSQQEWDKKVVGEETGQGLNSDRYKKDAGNVMIGAGSLKARPEDVISSFTTQQTTPRMNQLVNKPGGGYNHPTQSGKRGSIPASDESFSSFKQPEQPQAKNPPYSSQLKTSQPRNTSYQSSQSTSYNSRRSDNPSNPTSTSQSVQKQPAAKANSIAIPSQRSSIDFTANQAITPSSLNPSSTKNSGSSRKPAAVKDTVNHTASRRSLNQDTRCCNCGTTTDTVIVGSCSHSCCKSCLMRYAAGQMINNTFPNKCPVKSCSNELDGATVLSVLPNNFKEKYEELSLKQALGSDAGTKVVRCIGCSNTLTVDAKVTHMECPYCQKYYCLTCNSLSHPGKTCDENARHRSRSSVPIQTTSYYRR